MLCAVCGAGAEPDAVTCPACHQPALLSNKYRLDEVVRAHHHATTYRGVRCSDDLVVVVKQYAFRRPHVEEALEQLHTYLTGLARVNHPSLPVIFDQFQTRHAGVTSQWLVRSFVAGDSMETILRRHQFLQAEVVRFLFEVADVLRHLHNVEIPPLVHGALKPRHIIRPEGRRALVLVDFAMPGAEAMAIESARGAEVGYRAPELRQGVWSPAADVYGLGATALRLLTGREPAGLLEPSGRLARRPLEHLSEPVMELLDRMMSPDLDERIQDGAELRATLDAAFLASGLARRRPRKGARLPAGLTSGLRRVGRAAPAGLSETLVGAGLLAALGVALFGLLTWAPASARLGKAVPAPLERTCFGKANLLVDPGFEQEAPGEGPPDTTGRWSGDLTELVSAQGPLEPFEGTTMVAFRATRPTERSLDDNSEIHQLLRVADHPSLTPAPTSRLVACARFNRMFGSRSDSLFSVTVRAYYGLPANFEAALRKQEAVLGPFRTDVLTDSSPETWQHVCVDVPWTGPASYLAVELAAYENVHNDETTLEFAGHFVDDACLAVVTE